MSVNRGGTSIPRRLESGMGKATYKENAAYGIVFGSGSALLATHKHFTGIGWESISCP